MDKAIQQTAPYFDSRELRAELTANFRAHGDDAAKARGAMIERLKTLVADARAAARRGLEADHSGRRCAAGLSHFQDELIRVLYDYTRGARLSGDQSVGCRAHVDRRHRRLRPRAAGAGLRHRSAVPASLQEDGVGRERRRVHALHSVGSRLQGRARDAHRRSVHQDERRHHGAHGAARRAAHPRRRAALRRVRGALPHPGGGTARRAPSSTPRWRSAMRATARRARAATRSSPTSRTARAACATCTRCTGYRNISTARASARRRSPPASSAPRRSRPSAVAKTSCGPSAASCTSSAAARRRC